MIILESKELLPVRSVEKGSCHLHGVHLCVKRSLVLGQQTS